MPAQLASPPNISQPCAQTPAPAFPVALLSRFRALHTRQDTATPRPIAVERPRRLQPRSVLAWHCGCYPCQAQEQLCSMPPQHRHPLRRTPGCWVPAASRHAHRTPVRLGPIRRPGTLIHNCVLCPISVAACHAHCYARRRHPPPRRAQCSRQAAKQTSRQPLTALVYGN